MSNNKSGNLVLGTLIGAAVGFAAGMLLAPTSGREMRSMLGERTDEAKEAINDAASKTIASLKEVKQSAERVLKNTNKV